MHRMVSRNFFYHKMYLVGQSKDIQIWKIKGLWTRSKLPLANKWSNESYELEAQWAEPVSLTFHSTLRKLNTEPSVGASHQISVHFGKADSEKKIFRNRPI